jgi:hypothetical protein
MSYTKEAVFTDEEKDQAQWTECGVFTARPSVNEIAKALAAAQSEMSNPGFDSQNPHFRNKFASLAAVRNATVPVLAKHGISMTQDIRTEGSGIACTTILTHESGQSMTFGPLVMPATKPDAQGFGSAATYARRYALMAVCGVVGDDDDDANAATGKPAPFVNSPRSDEPSAAVPAKVQAVVSRMLDVMDADLEEVPMALAAYKIHDEVKAEHDLYMDASERLSPKQRASWKKLINLAKLQP